MISPRPLLLALLLLALSSCASRPPHLTGVLTVHNQLSGERESVRYRAPNGALDVTGAWRLSYLMRDVRAGAGTAMDPRLLDFLDALCSVLGVPANQPVIITSGYRTVENNTALRRTNTQAAESSYHMRGQALDIKIPGISGAKVAAAARQLRRGGVAYYPSSDHVHIDVGPVRSWTAY